MQIVAVDIEAELSGITLVHGHGQSFLHDVIPVRRYGGRQFVTCLPGNIDSIHDIEAQVAPAALDAVDDLACQAFLDQVIVEFTFEVYGHKAIRDSIGARSRLAKHEDVGTLESLALEGNRSLLLHAIDGLGVQCFDELPVSIEVLAETLAEHG